MCNFASDIYNIKRKRMKKFTLTLMACAVAFSGMAQMQKFVSPVPASIAETMASKVYQGTKFQVTATPQSVVAKNMVNMDLKKELAPISKVVKTSGERISFYHDPYIFSDVLGGYAQARMELGSYTVTGSTVKVNLYGAFDIDDIEGTIYDGPNSHSSDGLDSITFANNQQVAYLVSDQSPVVIATFDISDTDGDTYADTATPSTKSTFGAYYNAAEGTIYFMDNEFISLYVPNRKMHMDYIKGQFVTTAAADYAPYTHDAIVTSTSIYNDNGNYSPGTQKPVESPAQAIMFSDGVLVKGAIPTQATADNWVFFADNATKTGYDVATFDFLSEWTNQSGVKYSLVVYNFDSDGNGLETGSFTTTMDLDDNELIEATGWFGAYVFISNGQKGLWDVYDQYSVSISPDLSNGIKGVSTESGKVAAKEYFDLSGRKVENTAKGLVIEKVRYTDGKTVSRKVVK